MFGSSPVSVWIRVGFVSGACLVSLWVHVGLVSHVCLVRVRFVSGSCLGSCSCASSRLGSCLGPYLIRV